MNHARAGRYRPSFHAATVTIRNLSIALLAFSASAAYPQKRNSSPVDNYVRQQMHALDIPGLSMAVIKDGKVMKATGYGWANLETKTPASPATVYKTASLSKMFIATAVQMFTRAVLNDSTPVHYGLGWYVDSLFGHARIHHDGQFPGFRTDYERFADDKLTVILLANSDNASVESLAIKVAGFYVPSLATPPFTLIADAPRHPVDKGTPVNIEITARDDGHAAPDSLLEMEIWDASGKSVHKEHKTNEDFGAGQSKTYWFSWTPPEVGEYTVNVGIYGSRWKPSYAWKEHAARITVR